MPGRDLTVDGDPACVPVARTRSPAAVRHGSGAGKTRRTSGQVHYYPMTTGRELTVTLPALSRAVISSGYVPGLE